jgi:hypothetical protein
LMKNEQPCRLTFRASAHRVFHTQYTRPVKSFPYKVRDHRIAPIDLAEPGQWSCNALWESRLPAVSVEGPRGDCGA